MRFIAVFFITLFFSLTLGLTKDRLSDYENILNLNADYAYLLDDLNFAAFDRIFINNATYQIKPPVAPIAKGLPSIEAALARLAPPGTISQHAITTQEISVTQHSYASSPTAEGLSYVTGVYFGSGNLTGQIVTIYGRFEDTYVKTSQEVHGGWRIATRILNVIVSLFSCT